MGLLDDLDRRREEVQRTQENSARMAQSYAVFKTTGQGTMQYEERVDFGLTFIEKPIVSYASGCDVDDLSDILGIEDSDEVVLPICAGYVTHWDQDDRDFYAGCWVAVRVNFPSLDMIDPTLMPEVEHHFTFSAIGMKDVPYEINDAMDD